MIDDKAQVIIDKRLTDLAKLSAARAAGSMAEALKRASVYVSGMAKRLVYAGHPEHLNGDTGRLRQSITAEQHYPEAYVGSNVVYAPVHEFGATIRPKNKPRLAWRNKETGQWASALEVTIPKRPYLEPALEGSAPAVEAIFTNTIYTELLGGDPHAMPAGGGTE